MKWSTRFSTLFILCICIFKTMARRPEQQRWYGPVARHHPQSVVRSQSTISVIHEKNAPRLQPNLKNDEPNDFVVAYSNVKNKDMTDVTDDVSTIREDNEPEEMNMIVKNILMNLFDFVEDMSSNNIPFKKVSAEPHYVNRSEDKTPQSFIPDKVTSRAPCDSTKTQRQPVTIKPSESPTRRTKPTSQPKKAVFEEQENKATTLPGVTQYKATRLPVVTQYKATRLPVVTQKQKERNITRTYQVLPEIVSLLSSSLATSIGGTGNYFFSPFSISVALAMTYLGARGNTAREFETSLGYDRFLSREKMSQIHNLFHNALEMSGNKLLEVLVANGMFIQYNYTVLDNYTSELRTKYLSTVENVDFAHDGDKAAEKINNWASNKTKGKIPKLFETTPEPLTKMVLANAIYFKGMWKQQFNVNQTASGIFYKADKTDKNVSYMFLNEVFPYFTDKEMGYSFLRLQYQGKMAMIIALPIEKDEFPSLQFSNELVSYVNRNFQKEKILVKLPKFQMSYDRELSGDLKKLGLKELFSNLGSNLTGISKSNDLYVSSVTHKAFIEINEEGTEAAAATSVTFVARSRYGQPKSFIADHPFIFVILNNKPAETILFTGRVADP